MYTSGYNDIKVQYFNKNSLYEIVIAESSNSYLTNGVDEYNKLGMFADYKNYVDILPILYWVLILVILMLMYK